MHKYFKVLAVLFFVVLLAVPVGAARKHLVCYDYIGGGAGALDSYAHTLFENGSRATVISDGYLREYRYNSSSSNTEASPFVIAPDSGTGRWHLIRSEAGFIADSSQSDQGAASVAGDRTIKDFVDAFSGNDGVIVLPHNSGQANTNYALDTNETLPSNVYLLIEQGARITQVTGDETLTIYSPENIIAGKRQQITAVDMIDFTHGGVVYPEWWGTNTTPETTDMADAIQYAINSLPTLKGAVVQLGATGYKVTKSIRVDDHYIALKGAAHGSTRIVRGATLSDSGTYGNHTLVLNKGSFGGSTDLYKTEVRDIWFHATAAMSSGAHIYLNEGRDTRISNCLLDDAFVGIEVHYAHMFVIEKCRVWNTEALYPTAPASSAGFKFSTHATADYRNSGIVRDCEVVSGIDVSGSYDDTGRVKYGFWVQAADGIWFQNCHVINVDDYAWHIKPENNDQLTGLRFSDCWADFCNGVLFDGAALTSDTADGTTADKLVDSGATFSTDGVTAGDWVKNTTDGTFTQVAAVDSETQLSLDDDIFASGEDYDIRPNNYGNSVFTNFRTYGGSSTDNQAAYGIVFDTFNLCDVRVDGGQISHCEYDGIDLRAGFNIDIDGVTVRECNTSNSVGKNGIKVASGVSYFKIKNCSLGYKNLSLGTSLTKYGIEISGTSGDHYVILGNDLQGNTTGGLAEGPSGTASDTVVANNLE